MATLDSPIDSVTLADVGGHVDALGLLTLTDASGQVRDDLEWGIDEETTADIRTTAGSLVVSDYAGTLDTDHVEATVSSNWVAVCATPALTHVGRYKVKAYCTCPTTDTQVRLVWHSGEAPYTKNLPAVAHIADDPIELDLGVVNIVEQEGTHAWSGKVEVKADTVDTFEITDLFYIPADRYGRARAPVTIDTPSTFSARDEFNQAAGTLTGQTLPVGGTWAGAGDADDFNVNDTLHSAQRGPAGADADDDSGRYALAGATVYTAAAAQISMSVLAARAAVLLRYSDVNNWLMAEFGWTNDLSELRLSVRKRVAGTSTLLAQSDPIPALGGDLRLVALSSGAWVAELLGVATLAGADTDLATGGALDDGQSGLYGRAISAGSGCGVDDFIAWVPSEDHVIHPNRSMQLDHRSAQRENAAGTRWGDVPSYSGRRLLIPPATRNGNTSRLVVKQDRNDLTQLPVGQPSAAENLCTNPSAATDTVGWTNSGLVTFERSTSPPAGGPAATAFHAVGNAGNDHAYDEIAVESGKTYRFSAYVYLDSSTASGIALFVRDPVPGHTEAVGATFSTLDAWTRIALSVTATETDTWRFRLDQIGGGSTDFYFAGVENAELDWLTATLTVTPRVLLTS